MGPRPVLTRAGDGTTGHRRHHESAEILLATVASLLHESASVPPLEGMAMIKSLADLQRLGKHNGEAALQVIAEWNRGWQGIAAETIDFASRSLEDGAATLEKLFSAKSIEHALEIQSGFAKRACDAYLHQFSKIGGMYAELVRETYRPIVWAPVGSTRQ